MAAPSCRFDPQQMTVWSNQTGLCFVPDPHEGYRLAKPFLLEQMRKLLGQGWIHGDKNSDEDVLFHIHGTRSPERHIILPATFESFLDPAKASTWKAGFEESGVFKPKEQGKDWDPFHPRLYLATSAEISNIFYLLQMLAPGMLTIHAEYTGGGIEITISRVLPRTGWIETNYPNIGVTSIQGVDALLSAANNPETAFLLKMNGTVTNNHPNVLIRGIGSRPLSRRLRSTQTPNPAAETGGSSSHQSYGVDGKEIEVPPLEMIDPMPPVVSGSSSGVTYRRRRRRNKAQPNALAVLFGSSSAGLRVSGPSNSMVPTATRDSQKRQRNKKKEKANTPDLLRRLGMA